MVPEQLLLIDAILALLLETSLEKEFQRRIAASTRRAIGVVTAGLAQTGRSITGEVER
jgi:hypothetical protein